MHKGKRTTAVNSNHPHRTMAQVSTSREDEVSVKRTRRLKPGVAAKLVAAAHGAEIRELYSRPVQELSPEEIARMRAAFFRG
jgi:hypothetical protein